MIALAGIPFVPGVAAGAALTMRGARVVMPLRAARHGAAAREQLAEARRDAQLELSASLGTVPDGPARQILRAQLTLLADPMLMGEIDAGVESGLCAEDALNRAASSLAARFAALGDPVLRARAADLRDVCDCMARHLAGGAPAAVAAESRVVCATELSPAQVLQLIERRPLAIVLETAVESSHAAILVRALGVPAVIGVPRITELAADGDGLVVDGTCGRVVINPGPAALAALESAPAVAVAESDSEPVRTVDGIEVAITASVVDAADARRAFAAGADGIGLFRTEWLYLRTETLPSETVQYEAYREVAVLAARHPVTMRTIDLGSDKWPRALPPSREPNPALGVRGVRLAFAYPDLATAQLRALVRAFSGRQLRLLLPMVNDVDDVTRMRELVSRAGIGGANFELGVMIETPAAALMADELAAAADFLSLGTNDLTQYVLAVDRDNPHTAALYQPLHPAVLRLLRHVTTAAVRRGRPVAVCGEAASDPVAAPLLVGMGVTELSVPSAAVPRIKRLIRRTSVERARELADELMALPTAAAVATRLTQMPTAEAQSNVRATRDAQ